MLTYIQSEQIDKYTKLQIGNKNVKLDLPKFNNDSNKSNFNKHLHYPRSYYYFDFLDVNLFILHSILY